jgi:hypothetical protein
VSAYRCTRRTHLSARRANTRLIAISGFEAAAHTKVEDVHAALIVHLLAPNGVVTRLDVAVEITDPVSAHICLTRRALIDAKLRVLSGIARLRGWRSTARSIRSDASCEGPVNLCAGARARTHLQRSGHERHGNVVVQVGAAASIDPAEVATR